MFSNTPRLLVHRQCTGLTERIRFLWAKLQIDLLCCKKTEHDIVASLQAGLTEGLDAIYGDILTTISTMTDELASRILVRLFSWLLYARMPLTRELIDAALALDLEDDNHGKQASQPIAKGALDRVHIFGIGLNLILEDAQTNTIQFCHPSARDYLRSHPMFTPSTAELYLATGCLRQCIEGPSPNPYSHLSSCATDLYHYAAVHWAHHVRAAGQPPQSMPDALTSSLANFVFTPDDDGVSVAFLVWLDWIRAVSDVLPPYHHLKGDLDTLLSPDPSPLFAMAVFGLPGLLDHLPPSADLEAQNERGHTGLYLACLHGHLDMAKALLARGADPDVQCGSHGSPLGAACYRGYGSVVEMLLSFDALRRSQGVFEMAFEKACAGQHESIATMIVQHAGFPREYLEKAGRQAAEAGFRDLVNWLYTQPQQQGTPAATTDAMTKAVLASIRGGRVQVLQSFLRTRPQLKDRLPADAIAIAAAHGHLGMVKFLHDDQGFSASVESRLGSPLRNASLIGHVPIVRTLLEWGEDIDGCGERGSALQAAASRGHEHAVRFLVAEGADVNLVGQPWGTALQAAAFGGHLDVVRVLLKNGADVGQKGKFKDAFYAAVKGGHEAVAAELLERGYKFVPPDDSAEKGGGMPPIARGDEAVSEDEDLGFRGEDKEDARDPYADDDGDEEDSEDADSFESLTRRLVHRSGVGESSKMRQDILRARWKLLQPPIKGFPEACFRFAAEEGNLELLKMTMAEAATQLKDPQSSIREVAAIAASARRFEIVDFVLAPLGTLPHKSWRNMLLVEAMTGNSASIARTLHYRSKVCRKGLITATEAMEKLPATSMEAANLLIEWMLCAGDMAEWQEWAAQCGDHKYNLEFLIRAAAASTSREIFQQLLDFVETRQLFQPAQTLDGLVSLATAAAAGNNQANTWLLLEEARAVDIDLTQSTAGATNSSDPLPTSTAATGDKNPSLTRWANQQHWNSDHGPTTICQAIFLSAAEGGAVDILRQILQIEGFEDSPDFALTITQGLVTACIKGHTRAARFCLRNNADVNAVVAVRAAESEMMEDDDTDSDEPVARGGGGDGSDSPQRPSAANMSGDEKQQVMLNALQAALLRLGSLNRTMAPASAKTKQEALAQLILQRGGDPNDRGGRDAFPLQVVAKQRGPWRLVQALLDAGAEPDCGDTWPTSDAPERPINLATPQDWNIDPKNAGLTALQLIRAGAPVPLAEPGMLAGGLCLCISRWASINIEEQERIADLARGLLDGGLRDLALAIANRAPRLKDSCLGEVLCLAAAIGDHVTVNSLTRPGRPGHLRGNINGETAVELAAGYGQAEVMSRLLRMGVKPPLGLEERFPRSLWINAIRGGNARALELLKAQMPAGYFKENISWLLREAAGHGNLAALDLFLASGTDGALGKDADEAMREACDNGRQDIVSRLLDAGALADRPTDSWEIPFIYYSYFHSPIWLACRNGHVAIAKQLLDRGASRYVIASGEGDWLECLLFTAARHDHADVARLLLDAGADPNWKFDPENPSADSRARRAAYRLLAPPPPPYYEWAGPCRIRPFERFVDDEYVPPPERRPCSVLVEACRHNSASVVRELLRQGASVLHPSSQSDLAETLCEGEATATRLEIVGLVLDEIADPTKFQCFVSQLAREAALAENAGVMRYLVDFAAGDVDMLASACRCGSLHSVQTLLARGRLSVHACDAQGDTLLSIAARHMHLPVVEHLISLGADATAQNRAGTTALDSFLAGYASLGSQPFSVAAPKLEGSADLLQLLVEGGARPTPDNLCAAAVVDSALGETLLNVMLESGTLLSELETVLFASIDVGCLSMMGLLLQRGVNPHATRFVKVEKRGGHPADDTRPLTMTTQCALQAALGKQSRLVLHGFLKAAPDIVIITGGVTDNDFNQARHELELEVAKPQSAGQAYIANETNLAVRDLARLLQHEGKLFLPTRFAADCRRNEDVWPLVLRWRLLESVITVSKADWDQLISGAAPKLQGLEGRRIFRAWQGRRGMSEVCL